MTDLERAREPDAWTCPKCGLYGTESIHDSHVCEPDDQPRNAPSLKALLAIARQEGAEAARAEFADAIRTALKIGAGEMRERAAQVADEMAAHYEKRSRYTPVELDIGAVTGCEAVADAIRALSLTPEELT